ncbi:hypothetical protein K7X08_014027 [Anisodus acutangulus]|uniref:PAS domain-containing protein n=1 Tax=Anisodus acutangulus TaxID=402998 RepID=A0A9Q1LL72_9SOLA|nr:hypothetical protein K7X08_014027 [Anisodus acutangulus]
MHRNRTAEPLYGYSAEEALGQDPIELLAADARDFGDANNIVHQVKRGESWTGLFPVKNKQGDKFVVVVSTTPFYDDDGNFVGLISVTNDVRLFQETGLASMGVKQLEADARFRARNLASSKLGLDPQQPCKLPLPPKYLIWEDANSFKASTLRGDVHPSPFGLFSNLAKEEHSPRKHSRNSGDENEGKQRIYKIITSKAEEWMAKKSLPWPWKGNERDASEARTTRFLRPWLNNGQDNEFNHSNGYNALKPDNQLIDTNCSTTNEASGFWSSSFNVNSTRSSTVNKEDTDPDSLDYEIFWEDLIIGQNIGEGSCGTVYHGMWYGSDVAVKVFSKQEYSDEVIYSFKQEVSLFLIREVCSACYGRIHSNLNGEDESTWL